MGVKVVAPGSHVGVKQIDEMWNLHGEQLHNKPTKMLRPDSRRSAEIGNNRSAARG
jgi:hypothetical protein